MRDYQFPAEYCSEHPDRAARQIAAAWIEAVLRGNARDLYTTTGWTDGYRKQVEAALVQLQAQLDGGEPIGGAVWPVESKVGTLNPNPFASDAEQFV